MLPDVFFFFGWFWTCRVDSCRLGILVGGGASDIVGGSGSGRIEADAEFVLPVVLEVK